MPTGVFDLAITFAAILVLTCSKQRFTPSPHGYTGLLCIVKRVALIVVFLGHG